MPLPRPVVVGLGIVAALATWAAPAGADPARPTDYRSRILSIEGELPPGTEVAVVGGDAFFELAVPRGHTATVADTAKGPDGDPLPYLRYRADGRVERNASSFSAIANDTRYGTAGEAFDAGAPVRWEVVARDGSYVWHDHRIHWMSSTPPTAVDEGGRVDLGGPEGTWAVPLTVDGRAVVVHGELLLLDAPNPAGWIVVALALVAGAVALGGLGSRRHRPVPYRLVAGAAVVVAGAAAVTGWAAWQAIPAAAGGNAVPFAIPAVGLVAAAVALGGPARARLAALAATAAALAGWGLLRWSVLTHAVLPTDLPFAVDRAATALAIGTGVALAVLLVWQPPRRPRSRPTTSPTA